MSKSSRDPSQLMSSTHFRDMPLTQAPTRPVEAIAPILPCDVLRHVCDLVSATRDERDIASMSLASRVLSTGMRIARFQRVNFDPSKLSSFIDLLNTSTGSKMGNDFGIAAYVLDLYIKGSIPFRIAANLQSHVVFTKSLIDLVARLRILRC